MPPSGALSPRKTPNAKTPDDSGRDDNTSFPLLKVGECLYRRGERGTFYAIIKRKGKEFRRSLKPKFRYPGRVGKRGEKESLHQKFPLPSRLMESDMSTQTKKERLGQLGRRYRTAGLEHKKKLIDQAVELLGYHRKAAIRALNTAPVARVGAITGRGARIQAGKIGLPEPSAVW